MAFLIRHPDGREYELTDLDFFQREYAPQGFKIATNDLPHEIEIPEKSEVKESKEKAKHGAALDDSANPDQSAGDSLIRSNLHADHAGG